MVQKKLKNIKGLILAGGSGKRLAPLTSVTNKHLLNVYDKPMINYPLSMMMLSGIKNIGIVCNQHDKEKFFKLFENGDKYGLKITYIVQDRSDGICGGIKAARNYINNSSLFLILGDNFFYGNSLIARIINEIKILKSCTIFSYSVKNFKNYGIIEYNKRNKIKYIHEKPKKKYSGIGVTGMYLFNNSILEKINKIKPSKRNELEITDLINLFVKEGIKDVRLTRGVTWFDTGSFDDLLNASSFIRIVEKKQAQKIGCLEETAYKVGLISLKEFKILIKKTINPDLKNYLKETLIRKFDE